MGFVWGGVGRAQSRHFLTIFCYIGGFGDLGDPVVPTLEGCKQGCCDSICLLGYERTFFPVSSLAEGQSIPVPKTRNDCLHQ